MPERMKKDWIDGNYARVHSNAIRELSNLEFRVYCALCLHADTDGICFPSQERLTEVLGLKPTSVRNVRKALKSLVDKGWVARIERGNNKKQQANKYQLRIVGESIVSNRPCTEVTGGSNGTSA